MSKKRISFKEQRKTQKESVITPEERKILDDPKGWITGTGTPMVKRKIEKKVKKRSKKVTPQVNVAGDSSAAASISSISYGVT